VLTSDNPRSEDPLHILRQMRGGLARPDRVLIEADRAQAIARAVQRADARDVVLMLEVRDECTCLHHDCTTTAPDCSTTDNRTRPQGSRPVALTPSP